MKINWLRKLTSRKWWTSLAAFITLMIVAFGGSEDLAAQVASIIMAGAVVIGYTIGEGLIDNGNVSQSQKNVDIDIVKDKEEV